MRIRMMSVHLNAHLPQEESDFKEPGVCLKEFKNLVERIEEIEKNVYRVERPKTVRSVNEKEQDGSEF